MSKVEKIKQITITNEIQENSSQFRSEKETNVASKQI